MLLICLTFREFLIEFFTVIAVFEHNFVRMKRFPKLLVHLKRPKVGRTDLAILYFSCNKSVMDYEVPVFHYSFPKYLIQALERVQKRAMSIICPGHSCHEALDITINL